MLHQQKPQRTQFQESMETMLSSLASAGGWTEIRAAGGKLGYSLDSRANGPISRRALPQECMLGGRAPHVEWWMEKSLGQEKKANMPNHEHGDLGPLILGIFTAVEGCNSRGGSDEETGCWSVEMGRSRLFGKLPTRRCPDWKEPVQGNGCEWMTRSRHPCNRRASKRRMHPWRSCDWLASRHEIAQRAEVGIRPCHHPLTRGTEIAILTDWTSLWS